MEKTIELFLGNSKLAHDIADLLQAAGIEPYMQADSEGALFIFTQHTIWRAAENVLDEHASEVHCYQSVDDFISDVQGQYSQVIYRLAPAARTYLEYIVLGKDDEAKRLAEDTKRTIATSILNRIHARSGDDPHEADIILAYVSDSVL